MIHSLIRLLLPIGLLRMEFDLGGSAPAAPDYTPIANANEASAQIMAKTAADNLDFQKQQYADLAPLIKQQSDLGLQTSAQQASIAADNQAHANAQWNDYTTTYQPLEHQMVSDAENYGTEADQNRKGALAAEAVNQQGDMQQKQAMQNLESMGVNPNSGKFAAMESSTALAKAGAAAAASNQARTDALDKGIALRAGAANFGRNMPNTAAGAFSTAVGAGSSAVQNAGAGIGNQIAAGQQVSNAYGLSMQPQQAAIQANLGLAGLENSGYQAASQAAASSSAGMGSAIGGIGAVAAAFI